MLENLSLQNNGIPIYVQLREQLSALVGRGLHSFTSLIRITDERLPLAIDQLLYVLRVTLAFYRNLCRCMINLPQIVCRELNVGGAQVFFEPLHLCRPGDRHDPRLLRQQPPQGNLRRGGVLSGGDLAQCINER